MQPIDVPMTSRRWFTPRPLVSKRIVARRPCRHSRSAGKCACSPSLGFDDLPWPMPSGRMMKYFAASSRPPGTEQDAGELRPQELVSVAAGAVQDQDGVGDASVCVARWRAERRVVESHLLQRLAVLEHEVVQDEIAFSCRWPGRFARACGSNGKHKKRGGREDRSNHRKQLFLDGRPGGDRTHDISIKSRTLYRLSYRPIQRAQPGESPTSCAPIKQFKACSRACLGRRG